MRESPEYKNPTSLIPYGLPQFLDFEKNIENKDVKHDFDEEKVIGIEGKLKLVSYVRGDEPNTRVKEGTGEEFYGQPDYTISLRDLLPYMNQWIPVPFLRETSQSNKNQKVTYEKGPTNWARTRLIKVDSDKSENSYHLTLAFDMQVEDSSHDTTANVSAALSPDDVTSERVFSLASGIVDNAWFIQLDWVDEWIKEVWSDYYSVKKHRLRDELCDKPLAYIAAYITYLDVIKTVINGLKVKIANYSQDEGVQSDKKKSPPVEVDLILDIGNSRTTGLLIESQIQRSLDLNQSYVLQLRDLSFPENIYREPFKTCVEFAQANFGKDDYSRRSGRKSKAFRFPSTVRIGPEASRMASVCCRSEGTSGMSSPKRYLWDEEPWEPTWRFTSEDDGAPNYISGLLFDLTDTGLPLCCKDEPRFKGRYCASQKGDLDMPGFDSKYTRSSMMMHLMMEIIQQALLTINSPGQRGKRIPYDVPRHLRKIVLTLPAGMPIAEQNIYRRWVEFAVRTFWDAMGWNNFYKPQGAVIKGRNYLNRPDVVCNWDEATCTQIVFLYNEIITNHSGDSTLFFDMFGRRYPKYKDKKGVRIATIDMGGGTTDLSITTYTLENESSATTRLSPHQEIRDGFNIAGDDVVRALITDIVLKSFADHIEEKSNKGRAEDTLRSIFGKNMVGGDTKKQTNRGQFTRQVLVPIAYALLSYYEKYQLSESGQNIHFKVKEIFDGNSDHDQPFLLSPRPVPGVVRFIEDEVREKEGIEFDFEEVRIDIPVEIIDEKINEVINDPIKNMAELISLYNCDALLLTGRPSLWRAFQGKVISFMPVASNRVFPMSNYKVGSWYPYADSSSSNIKDPKTTVVVGAILSTLAQNELEGFVFDAGTFSMKSTARYIGELGIDGLLSNDKVWFEVDLDNKSEQQISAKHDIEFSSQIVIGFRQLAAPRWTATRAYRMDYASPEAQKRASNKTPYLVKLKLYLDEMLEGTEHREEGELVIEDIENKDKESVSTRDLKILLRTLRKEEDEGFWLDTGVLF